MYLPILLTFPFSFYLGNEITRELKVLDLFFDDNHYDGFCFPAREHDDERKIELKLFLTDKCFGKLAYQPHPIDKWRRNHSYFMNIESNIADVNREVACKRWVAINLIDISAFPKKIHTPPLSNTSIIPQSGSTSLTPIKNVNITLLLIIVYFLELLECRL